MTRRLSTPLVLPFLRPTRMIASIQARSGGEPMHAKSKPITYQISTKATTVSIPVKMNYHNSSCKKGR